MAEQVKDLMIPITDYPTLNKSATIHQAVELMEKMSRAKGYRWVVVLEDDGSIAGFLTLRNIFEALSNLAPKAGGWLGISFNRPDASFWEGVQLVKNTPVKKLIRPVVDVFVLESDLPAKAAEIILKKRINILPVVDSHLKVVGIVRPVDFLPFYRRLFSAYVTE